MTSIATAIAITIAVLFVLAQIVVLVGLFVNHGAPLAGPTSFRPVPKRDVRLSDVNHGDGL